MKDLTAAEKIVQLNSTYKELTLKEIGLRTGLTERTIFNYVHGATTPPDSLYFQLKQIEREIKRQRKMAFEKRYYGESPLLPAA